jgi:hypothetical protein
MGHHFRGHHFRHGGFFSEVMVHLQAMSELPLKMRNSPGRDFPENPCREIIARRIHFARSDNLKRNMFMGEGRRGHRHAGIFPEGGGGHRHARAAAGLSKQREAVLKATRYEGVPRGEHGARDIPAQCLQCPRGKSRPCPPGGRCFE